MAGQAPIQVVVAAFQDERQADAVYQELRQARKDGTILVQNAAVLRKDVEGKLHVRDVHDMGGGKGAAIGGVLGAVLGLIAGPVGWAALGGAVAGGLVAKHADGGFSDARLRKLGEGLKPGSSAIVAVVEHVWVNEVQDTLAEAGADYVTEALSADIAAQLAAGGEVSYTAVITPQGVATAREATSAAAGGDTAPEAPATGETQAGV